MTDETKAKISAANKGKIRTPEVRAKIAATLMGHPVTVETRERIGKSCMGKNTGPMRDETKHKISQTLMGHAVTAETRAKVSTSKKGTIIPSLRGKKLSKEHCRKLSASHMGHKPSDSAIQSAKERTGPLSHFWKGGVTSENMATRLSAQYNQWRKEVFARDGYTCQGCGKIGKNLNAHHLWSFADHEDSRFVVDNGVTLCHSCHRKFHSIFGMGDNTPDEFHLFLSGLTRVDMDSKSIDEGSIPSRPAKWVGGRAAIAADCKSVASATGVRVPLYPPEEGDE